MATTTTPKNKSNVSITKHRAAFEKKIYNLLDDIDPTGYNTEMWKSRFNKMSDKDIVRLAKQVRDEFATNIGVEIKQFGKRDSDFLSQSKINRIAKKYGVNLRETVMFRHSNKDGAPSISREKLLILIIAGKKLQQMVSKKSSIVYHNDVVNPLTGQVTGASKGASLSNSQSAVLNITGETNTIKEFLGPRADDFSAKQKMMQAIEENGEFTLNELEMSTQNKQSIQTYISFMRSIGFDVSF